MHRSVQTIFLAAAIAFAGTGCGDASVVEEELVGADDTAAAADALTGAMTVGSSLKTTSALNLRSGPSTGYRVLLVIPQGALVKVVQAYPQNGFYNVKYGTTTGWASGSYLVKVTTTTPSPTVTIVGGPVVANAQSFANAACASVGCPYRVGTYAGHSPTQDRAIDFMQSSGGVLPPDGGVRGDKLGAFTLTNFAKYRAMYVIWEQRINSNDGRGWRWMEDRGSITQNHYDHVHVSFNL